MKALLKIEAIGYNDWKQSNSLPGYLKTTKRRWWVAKIAGYDDRYGYKREFVKGQTEYADSNSKASRGVFIYYLLDPGVYEVNSPLSWRSDDRYFILSEHGKIKRISEADAKKELGTLLWLKKITSE